MAIIGKQRTRSTRLLEAPYVCVDSPLSLLIRLYYDKDQQAACGLTRPKSTKYGREICYGNNLLSRDEFNDPPLFTDVYDACHQPDFVYPWFGTRPWYRPMDAPGNSVPLVEYSQWTYPPDATTRKMFRLPYVDISKMQCTPSVSQSHSLASMVDIFIQSLLLSL